MIKKLNNWLQDSGRKYAEGVAMFAELGSQAQKENFLEYFQSGVELEKIGRYDSRFTILVNQLTIVRRRLQTDPAALAKAAKTASAKVLHISAKAENDKSKDGKKQDIDPDKPPFDVNNLPEELTPSWARLKEIVPLMARVHADMSNEALADDKRGVLRVELINLDDERREIWSKIDQFQKDGLIDTLPKPDGEEQVEQNMLQLGAEIQREISNLRSNVTRNTNDVKKYAKAGDKDKEAKAQERLDAYKTQLAELEKLVNVE